MESGDESNGDMCVYAYYDKHGHVVSLAQHAHANVVRQPSHVASINLRGWQGLVPSSLRSIVSYIELNY